MVGYFGFLSLNTGSPDGNASTKFIPSDLWSVVSAEILNQCDELDGVRDGIITEPDDCDFNPDVLLCSSNNTGSCLSKIQVDALHKVYSPLYGNAQEFLYPRYDPGAEAGQDAVTYIFGGTPFPITEVGLTYGFLSIANNELIPGLDDVCRLQGPRL